MADFRIIVSDRNTGLAHQIEVSGSHANNFIGRRIGDIVSGDAVGLPGYTLKIKGGTDKGGFPMRSGLPSSLRRKILVSGGVGFNSPVKGMRRRKTMRGEEISSDISQVNVIIEEYGTRSIDDLLGGGAGEEGTEEESIEESVQETAEASAEESAEKAE